MAKVPRDDIDRFHEHKLYLPTRTIYVGSEFVSDDGESGVDALLAERVIKNLLILEEISHDPITIVLNNVGGDVSHGLAVYDMIKTCESPVIIKVFGNACSMGSIILQAGDERQMSENSSQMIHYGYLALDSHAKTAYKTVEKNKKDDKWMEQLYLAKIKEKNPHYTLQRLQRILDHDTYLSAQESVELGLADSIIKEKS